MHYGDISWAPERLKSPAFRRLFNSSFRLTWPGKNRGSALLLICDQWILKGSPDSKFHGANMGPTWVLSAPDGPHVGPMNLAIWVSNAETFPFHTVILDMSSESHIVMIVWELELVHVVSGSLTHMSRFPQLIFATSHYHGSKYASSQGLFELEIRQLPDWCNF